MKRQAPIQRSEEWTRFTGVMGKILSVSKDELNKREAEYKVALEKCDAFAGGVI